MMCVGPAPHRDYLPWFPIFGGDGHACSDCNNDGFFLVGGLPSLLIVLF